MFTSTSAFANGPVASGGRWGTGHRHKQKPQYEDITAVDEGAKTVTVGHKNGKDHSTEALKINDFTEITVDGQKATLKDLKPGMKVDVDRESDDIASTLTATHVQK